MKTKRDIVVALIALCAGPILAALLLSHLNLNASHLCDKSKFNYETYATSTNAINTFPGKKSTDITYQPPCAEADINRSDEYKRTTDMHQLNTSEQILSFAPTKTRVLLYSIAISFCMLTQPSTKLMKNLKKAHYHHHQN